MLDKLLQHFLILKLFYDLYVKIHLTGLVIFYYVLIILINGIFHKTSKSVLQLVVKLYLSLKISSFLIRIHNNLAEKL